MTTCIEFLGTGSDEEAYQPGTYHAVGSACQSDYTLCGITLDGDDQTAGDYVLVQKRINCENCVEIIQYCKRLRT